ncbi:hypothetical protein Ahy_A07g035960 [Arachis hypogaea]|uniref:Uncharacterized protein n=1 Tax=Arachis hypogaea TaxID=3818 RepID=A0A445CET4_ARAHY|nr:hypothetical protein Ahy_A07g035960 [Arachis hypogaea]
MNSREERSRGGPPRTAQIPRIYIGSHLNCLIYPPEEKFGFKPRFEQEKYAMLIRSSLLLGCEAVSNQTTQQALAPLAFVSQCQCRPSRVLSSLVFFLISTHFTAPPEISSAPTVLQLGSFHRLSRVEPWDLTANLKSHL